MMDNFVSRYRNGTGPKKRNAIAIKALPQIDKIEGCRNLSQILEKNIYMSLQSRLFREKENRYYIWGFFGLFNMKDTILTNPPKKELSI